MSKELLAQVPAVEVFLALDLNLSGALKLAHLILESMENEPGVQGAFARGVVTPLSVALTNLRGATNP